MRLTEFWLALIGHIPVRLLATATLIGLVFFVLIAFGQLPAVFSGFAPETALQASIAESHHVWAEQLDTNIVTLRAKQCAASNDEVRQLYWGRISKSISAWQSLTGFGTYPLPACSEL